MVYKEHLLKLYEEREKFKTKYNIILKLTISGWEADAGSLKTSPLALVHDFA